jgi:hypothetical protein
MLAAKSEAGRPCIRLRERVTGFPGLLLMMDKDGLTG